MIAERLFDPWGQPIKIADGAGNTLNKLTLLDRGFTGHEHLQTVGLIHMNGRLYDPVLHRFLQPDNFVQDPFNTQNFNRYGYCLNNPLVYVDENGEFWHLIIGAVVGGVINWAFNGARLDAKGLGYFAVGAVAGAVGAGIGSGVSASLAGGTFAGGFMSTSVAVSSSFINGAAIGAASGLGAGFVGGFGNGLVGGQNIGQAFGSGITNGLIGMGMGGVIGGLSGGIDAVIDGRRFWDGATVQKNILAQQNIPKVGQVGDNNCLPASAEAVDKSFGGNMTQEQIRDLVNFGSNPNTVPLEDVGLWDAYTNASGHSYLYEYNKANSLSRVLSIMQGGGRVAINMNIGENVGHSVIMQSIVQKTITKLNGSVIQKTFYYVMNPANGGSIHKIDATQITNSYNIFYISR
ncbi:RHS repeat-associated core domain-containing protein [Capnocytophaga ochracea]|nr:RHS repeat-associated core domain-containing protein [Capnocytophaga ochracea]